MKIINTGRAGGMAAVIGLTVFLSVALFVGFFKCCLAIVQACRANKEER